MIEVISNPANLADWKPDQQPFYLEIFGETSPLVNTAYAEVVTADPQGGLGQVGPIYEYWWTIGHTGLSHHMNYIWEYFSDDLWHNLENPAARVYLYFPLNGGWRIRELVATVKYLTPFPQQANWWTKVADDWKQISPLVDDASKLAAAVPNPAFTGAASLLSTIARLQINSVPQTDGFDWSVGKVSFGSRLGVMQGVMWTLPPKMFTELGGRLTGSVAVTFIPSQVQTAGVVGSQPRFQQQPILAHAVVYGPGDPIWVPGQHDFIELAVAPKSK